MRLHTLQFRINTLTCIYLFPVYYYINLFYINNKRQSQRVKTHQYEITLTRYLAVKTLNF